MSHTYRISFTDEDALRVLQMASALQEEFGQSHDNALVEKILNAYPEHLNEYHHLIAVIIGYTRLVE